jgi:Fe-S-cluster containining protein
MTRQTQRQRRKALRKDGEKVLRNGLALAPGKDALLGLAVVLRDVLSDAALPSRAADAAEIVHRVNDTSQRKTPEKVAVACAKGCSYCCHTYVSAMAPEIFRIARAIRAEKTFDQRLPLLRQSLQLTAGRPNEERQGKQLPCALLENGLCSVYASRPSMCRKTASTSLDDCIAVFNGGAVGWTSPRINSVAASASLYAFSIALHSQKLDWQSYELSAALEAVLADPDAEAAWLGGRDIFANVRRDPRPADFERNVILAAGEIA